MNPKPLLFSVLLVLLPTACGDSEGEVRDTVDANDTDSDDTGSNDTAGPDSSDSTSEDTAPEDTTAPSDTDTQTCDDVGEPCETGIPGACATGLGACIEGVFACVPPDRDSDGLFDCLDGCPDNPSLFTATPCGCDDPVDTDADSVADCADGCPNDPAKTSPGACGCGVADLDEDLDGLADCTVVPTCESGLECGANERCELLAGLPSCVCNEGYAGRPCVDLDECAIGDVCGALRDCVNIPGGFECPCKPGFREDGAGACVDLDECASSPNPCGSAYCINRYGAFECGCDPLTSCDVFYSCEEDQNCTACDPGDTRICRTCRPGFSPQPLLGIDSVLSCESTNECLTLNPVPTARHIGPDLDRFEQLVCVDTETSYTLTCRPGFVLDETVSPAVCRDIDECALPTTSCGPEPASAFELKGECVNLAGSYRCSCPYGWTARADGLCADIDECSANRCNPLIPCENRPGSYACLCPEGMEGDPATTGCSHPLDPARTFCEGFGWHMAAVGQEARLRCYFVDIWGRKRAARGNELTITVTGPQGDLPLTPISRFSLVEVVYVPPTAGFYDIVVEVNGQQVIETRRIEAKVAGPCASAPFDYLGECGTPVLISGPSSEVTIPVANLPDNSLFTLGRAVRVLSYDDHRGIFEVELVRPDGVRFAAMHLAATRANFQTGPIVHRLCLRAGTVNKDTAGDACPLFAWTDEGSVSGDGGFLEDPSPYPLHVAHVLLGNAANENLAGDFVNWAWTRASASFFAQFNNDLIVGGPVESSLSGDASSVFLGTAAIPIFGHDELIANGPSRMYGDCRALVVVQNNVTRTIELGNDILVGSDGADTLYGDFASGSAREGSVGPTMVGGEDTLRGGAGDDVLYGDGVPGQPFAHDASDVLEGGPGNDLIVGTSVTFGRTAGDTYVFDLSDARGFGDDTLVSAARGAFGANSDTLRFVGVPDTNGDSTVTDADLFPLTRAVAVGAYVKIEVFADLAQTRKLGSFYLPSVIFIHPTLQGYPFKLELR